MRQEFVCLVELGRMPNESLSDDASVDCLINCYDAHLERITLPLSYEEALVLVRIFPESAFYDLQWHLLQLVESMIKEVSEADYLRLISQCPSEEWREGLINRYKNWKATVGAEEDNLSDPDPTSSF